MNVLREIEGDPKVMAEDGAKEPEGAGSNTVVFGAVVYESKDS